MDSGPVVLYAFRTASVGDLSATDGPLALAFGVSNQFYSAVLARRAADSALVAGAHGYIANIPPGWSLSVLFSARRGINAAVHAWGEATRARYHRERLTLDDDPLSKKLSYVQDDGGFYCFCEFT